MGRRKRERKLIETLARLDERQQAASRAVELQASEYDRRLEGLNHEAARIKAAADASVSRELFDAKTGEIDRGMASVNLRMAAWAGAGAVLALFINWFLRRAP